MKILFKSFVDFFRDDGPMFAAGISCFSMLAIVPFLLLLVSIFGYLLGQDNELYHFFLAQVVSLFPRVTHQVTTELESIMRYREIGILTLVIYAFFSYQLYVSLEAAPAFSGDSGMTCWFQRCKRMDGSNEPGM